ncbi:hypothetical protein FHW72_002682 [Ochrobactrum sp. RC6B]|nr:hypothetical protein [Ochrobactrum sp. RC6B]
MSTSTGGVSGWRAILYGKLCLAGCCLELPALFLRIPRQNRFALLLGFSFGVKSMFSLFSFSSGPPFQG